MTVVTGSHIVRTVPYGVLFVAMPPDYRLNQRFDNPLPVDSREFASWCDERGITCSVFEPDRYVIVHRVMVPDDDTGFEFRMRWV